ncbi:hypothetical protein Tco_0280679 [Tanacetum coccineum]
MANDMMRQLPPEASRQEAFEDLVLNFIHDQEEKVKQLEECMCVVGSDFMQLFLELIKRLKKKIRIKENGVKKVEKITRYPDIEDLEPLNGHEFSEALTEKASFHTPKFENTLPVTYPDEVEETIGLLIEVEPLDETPLEDLGLNTCNHDNPLSSREIPSFDELEPQPQPFHSFLSLEVDLGNEREPEPPIKPPSPDSFMMKEVDHLTIHTPPSPHEASFHPKDTYCYYHPCIDDPKKHYGFKPGLLGHSGSLSVDFSKLEMIEDDLELESKEVSFLGRRFNSPVRPK